MEEIRCITYEDISEVNKKIKTTDIKGKAYADVNERIKAFRKLFPTGMISTEMISNENGVCVFKAIVADETGSILGTGHAYEKEGSTFINKTSYIENAETSAVGRALGMAGIGIDTSVASYEEVANAMANQTETKHAPKKAATAKPTQDSRAMLREYIKANGLDGNMIAQVCGLNKDSTEQDFAMALVYAKSMVGGIT
jgi:hypothetical protein